VIDEGRAREFMGSCLPKCTFSAGDSKIDGSLFKKDSSAILLYEAPTGFAIFSFDGSYLDNPVEVLYFVSSAILCFSSPSVTKEFSII
jgi:hypothetical protein